MKFWISSNTRHTLRVQNGYVTNNSKRVDQNRFAYLTMHCTMCFLTVDLLFLVLYLKSFWWMQYSDDLTHISVNHYTGGID